MAKAMPRIRKIYRTLRRGGTSKKHLQQPSWRQRALGRHRHETHGLRANNAAMLVLLAKGTSHANGTQDNTTVNFPTKYTSRKRRDLTARDDDHCDVLMGLSTYLSRRSRVLMPRLVQDLALARAIAALALVQPSWRLRTTCCPAASTTATATGLSLRRFASAKAALHMSSATSRVSMGTNMIFGASELPLDARIKGKLRELAPPCARLEQTHANCPDFPKAAMASNAAQPTRAPEHPDRRCRDIFRGVDKETLCDKLL
eukprot:CAMPEP_0204134514 /NCGR_PEP_ID=MMETSP0361-20130328/15714_1 /ASSEMBLY_ACC=CAM_ASM_000343 /TAXON_ID=268821 /ORGANISM="Scrippsiella Hangoei, Strain SHTV-5" /LENGTH=258 /DNA_ID=CAMNT_0051087721 /DNA_START=101 /DNA_END=875 /DNA_ORIENTATION=+